MNTLNRLLCTFALATLTTGCALIPTLSEECAPLSPPQTPRPTLDGLPHGIVSIPCEAALCYAIVLDPTHPPGASLRGVDVVLIDTGIDSEGALLHASLDGAHVVQVWVTHGHIDHWAAAHTFVLEDGRPTPVFVHRDDIPFMDLRRQHRSVMATLGQRLLPLPPLPQDLRPFTGGDRLHARTAQGAVEAAAIHLPGHTPGASAFHFKNVLFSGDTLVAPQFGGVCAVQGFLVTDDETTAWRSLRTLRDVDFEILLDGNYGRTDGAASLVQPSLLRWRARTDG